MAENTSDNREGTDFTGFLEDAVEKHRVLVSHKVAILKKKQGLMGQWDQAGTSQDEPSTSSSTVINYVQREPCPYGDDENHWCMNLDQHPGETAPGVDTSKPVLYIYDEDEPKDDFEDFLEDIEEGDDAITEYSEPSTSSSTVTQHVQREPCPYGDDINHWCMNLQQHSLEPGPGVDTSKPLLYLYDEIDPHSVDQFKDFFEAIEEGDVAIREYIELYEYEIFNDDYDDLDKKLAAMEKKTE